MTILRKWENCHGEALVTFEKEHRWCEVQKKMQCDIHKYLKKLSINLNLYSNKGTLIQAK